MGILYTPQGYSARSRVCDELTRAHSKGILSPKFLGRYQSGQLGQTVNLLAFAFAGSNPARPTTPK